MQRPALAAAGPADDLVRAHKAPSKKLACAQQRGLLRLHAMLTGHESGTSSAWQHAGHTCTVPAWTWKPMPWVAQSSYSTWAGSSWWCRRGSATLSRAGSCCCSNLSHSLCQPAPGRCMDPCGAVQSGMLVSCCLLWCKHSCLRCKKMVSWSYELPRLRRAHWFSLPQRRHLPLPHVLPQVPLRAVPGQHPAPTTLLLAGQARRDTWQWSWPQLK